MDWLISPKDTNQNNEESKILQIHHNALRLAIGTEDFEYLSEMLALVLNNDSLTQKI